MRLGTETGSVIEHDGRLFVKCEASEEHLTQARWALGVLSRPAVIYPNGRNSHEAAGEVLDKAEDGLIEFLRFTA